MEGDPEIRVTLANLVVDCRNAAALAAFWASVLERPVDEGASDYFATVGAAGPERLRPMWMFIQLPEERSGKNRVHPDLATSDLAAEVTRLEALGATKHSEHDEFGTRWVTLSDPEGNVFDVAQHRS